MAETQPTDAEKLAAAEAAMFAAAEDAKAARLPSALVAFELLNSPAAAVFLNEMREAVSNSVDDLARSPQTGAEGAKQTLQRIITSFDLGVAAIQSRLSSLQPSAEASSEPEPEA